MLIRASDFGSPDPNKPDYSLFEVDFYGALAGKGHRLGLRKNLKTDRYEVYKAFKESEEVCYTYPSLSDAVRVADRLTEEVTGYNQKDAVEE